ncbi:MAG: DUF4198 domain-containing protein [Hyphomonadaceae bacterium]
MKQHLLAAVLFAAAVGPAAAYTSYIKPDQFWPTNNDVEVEGSFATQFFAPQIALGSDVAVLDPNGAAVDPSRLEVTPVSTVLEAELAAPGTYRISSGEVLGQVATLVGENGTWRALGAGEIPPEGAEVTTLQTVTLADAYVTRGAVSRNVVDAPTGRLAIRPVTHPNQVLTASGFEIEVLFDGAPMPNTAVVLYSAGDPETKLDRYVVTDADGRALFTLDGPGQYIVAARHRAAAPAGAEAAVRSYTTTVTFEAYDTQPVIQEEAPPQTERRRTREPARRRVGRPDY